jgi:hypothetical protein
MDFRITSNQEWLSLRFKQRWVSTMLHRMNLARFLISISAILVCACATASSGSVPELIITTYPFVASPDRAALIRNRYKEVASGMSAAEVDAIFGKPDEIRSLYEPLVKNGKLIGHTRWYVIRRLVQYGSANQKQEALVRVGFGLNDRVSSINAWGL